MGASRASRRPCGGRSRTVRSCVTTRTTSSRATSRCRSRCSTTSGRGSCCRRSTTATRRACTRRRSSRGSHRRQRAPRPSTPLEMQAGARVRVAYLGPAGTFSEEALLSSADAAAIEHVPVKTIYDAVIAVSAGDAEFAVVPLENSLEGSVSVTLDLLAGEARDLRIVAEVLLRVSHALIASERVELSAIDTVFSHPQVLGQCALFLRSELAHARTVA